VALAVTTLLVGALLAACSSTSSHAVPVTPATRWVDQPVTFRAGGLTIYATYRHPIGPASGFPAALLIAGSGPTDRNGNSAELAGSVDTLQAVADWLSTDGVASLRYDKLGSGQTGIGPYASDPDSIGIGVFNTEATAALTFLAAQSGVDRSRLAVVGHSEGALFALLLATGNAGKAPPVHALVLLEPLSRRYLDVITEQITAQLAAQQQAGKITAALEAQVLATVATAVQSLRTSGKVAAGLPYGIDTLLSPATALFLSQTDKYDPAQLASRLGVGFPVLVSCSNDDVQVSCTDVDHLVGGLTSGHAATDFVQLTGVDHVLKQDTSLTAANYGSPLPFSTQLQTALHAFVAANL
jgi:uncharacterized protein